MRCLANENFPLKSVFLLRTADHDVTSITEDSPGIKDQEVLERAVREQRFVLTFDRDYGELIYKRKLPTPIGIIYFRFDPLTPEEPGEHLLELFRLKHLTWEGKFSTIERRRVRQRLLKSR
ncbi:hypothetical protein U27_04281 [Candidatus Vecturithrix granuli]|uniref:DUF5615 domain-containing protein n=1 Tax=Vecturithrix granuli TaxID=1499967 RepID=A0A081BYB1_VECG1|nr:hypothetical protein U27_04281 [Candidatus Vecturithrix granuli]